MSASVLYDSPGPKTIARHRVYSIVATLALIVVIALVVIRFQQQGQFAYELWEPFITPVYVEALLRGLLETLKMAATSIVLAVIFGVIFGSAKLSERGWIRWPAWAVVEFFRAVPVLLLMVFFFLAYGVGSDGIGAYWCVVFALTLYNGAVLAEIFRAGILALPAGQAEAAYAIGMRKSQVMNIILLPQAVKIMLPALISQCVVTLKDTSLGFYIVAPGLTAVGKAIYTEFQNQVQTAIVVTAMYVTVNLLLTALATWVQKRYVGEKALSTGAVAQAGGGMATGENTGGAF